MIKSKHFVFVAVIAVMIFLVVGNWVTPAQANSADIVSPTPTSTPTTDPNSQGDPVSLELQEELKGVIQSYFEKRYRALSVSQSADFQLNGFGDLVSNGAEANLFLDAELGKLAVEIKYAELNHSRYVDYKYFLDFTHFTLDASSQLATVSLIEDNEIIYENSAEHDPAKPVVAHMSGLQHTIVLRQNQGPWKIVSDDYNDFLWRQLRKSGKSKEEMLKLIQKRPAPPSPTESDESVIASSLPVDVSSHAYDRAGAVNYALGHAAVANYNTDYPNYDDGEHGDCTNFVSQAVYEGGNASMSIPDPLPAPDPGGQSGWYLLNFMQRATDWNDVGGFYDFVTNYAYPTEGPEGYELAPVPEGQVPAGLMLGDVIQYEADGDTTWDHSAIVVGFDGSGDPLVASHSPNIPQIHFMNVVAHIKTRFIHIERSDGYPPVKTEIRQDSDDAGTNYFSCSFSIRDNEIYLGTCSTGGNITSGFRFINIQIPKNAIIKYAYITYTVDGPFTLPVDVQIYGEDSGNAAKFTNGSPPSNRSTPYPPVLWNITEPWEWGMRRTTPQLSPIIQNIVNRVDWLNGNSLVVIIKNTGSNVRRVMAYERAAPDPNYSPAKLIITYDLTP